MSIKNILSIAALAGALFTGGVASADHDRQYDYRSGAWRHRRASDDDVIGIARLSARRGTVEFRITPKMRRDGLQLRTDANRMRILSVELEYSDGRIVELDGNYFRRTLQDGERMLIQRGRPAGLRFVRVQYAKSRYDRVATLELIQIHTGSGYTREGDRDFADDEYYDEGDYDRDYDEHDRY